jgi:hypothetical protein
MNSIKESKVEYYGVYPTRWWVHVIFKGISEGESPFEVVNIIVSKMMI